MMRAAMSEWHLVCELDRTGYTGEARLRGNGLVPPQRVRQLLARLCIQHLASANSIVVLPPHALAFKQITAQHDQGPLTAAHCSAE